jgi:uncharacterized protein (UPF0335 family)
MNRFSGLNPRQRLVRHVQELERLEELKRHAADDLKDGFEAARADGYDPGTLRIVLKLRKLTPDQRRERRALEAIYLAALGMLEGDPLPDEARRRLDSDDKPASKKPGAPAGSSPSTTSEEEPAQPPAPAQPSLILKDPEEARAEGATAAEAGRRIYDNPYPAGDPCRAAWDEGWCAQQKSHGMETPSAYQRRTPKPAEAPKDDKKPGADDDAEKKGAA